MILDISFEVYPPRDPADAPRLEEAIRKLAALGAKFISVTFGAGGSSTRDSLEVLKFIKANTSATPLAHLTCVGTVADEARELVRDFIESGVTDFLALRGDLPQGMAAPRVGSLSRADQLVQLIGEERGVTPGKTAVAAFPNGHPESGADRTDIDALLAKQDAGAHFAITQLFFYTRDYLEFVELANSRGVTIPIIPGIMPIVSLPRLRRVLELSGEREPEELAAALANSVDAESRKQIGIDWAANQIAQLQQAGVGAAHLYAFNEHANVTEVLRRSGARD